MERDLVSGICESSSAQADDNGFVNRRSGFRSPAPAPGSKKAANHEDTASSGAADCVEVTRALSVEKKARSAFNSRYVTAPKFEFRSDGRRRVIFDAAEIDRLTVRFWSKVDRSGGAGACHLWTGALAVNGYGQWHPYGGVHVPAHRFALILKLRRNLGAKEVTLHLCRSRACCNLDHLTVGSYADNHLHAEMEGTGLTAGERNPMSKLTAADVMDLRARAATEYKMGWLAAEARRLGVSAGDLGRIIRGQYWSHLPGAVDFGPRAGRAKLYQSPLERWPRASGGATP